MSDFISEDDLQAFEGWLKYQGVNVATIGPEELARWQRAFDEIRERSATVPKVGLMRLQPRPGEHLFAVAVREGSELWLTLWVRRSVKGEFFVLRPLGDKERDVHASYHLDGTFHMKSYGDKVLPPTKRQPLTGAFRGTEHLGVYYGHSPKSVGAICDPAAFAGVVEVASGVLGPRDGGVAVNLIEPGHEPTGFSFTRIVTRQTFREVVPHVVITVGSS